MQIAEDLGLGRLAGSLALPIVAIIDAEGDYGAVIVSGANLRLSNEDLEEARDVIRNAQVLVLQNEVPEATNIAAAKLAKGYRIHVVFNAAPARPLGPDLAANIDDSALQSLVWSEHFRNHLVCRLRRCSDHVHRHDQRGSECAKGLF
jgi:hypothetical protein